MTNEPVRREVEIDRAIVEAMIELDRRAQTLTSTISRAHYSAGDRLVRNPETRRSEWTMTDGEAIEAASPTAQAEVEAAETARNEAHAALTALNAQYTGWSRFYLVQNNGGHIHRTMRCSTCFLTTQFAWLPDLSGLGEADAVAAHGAILCTVCFPSAPVEWTGGEARATIEAREARAAERAARAAAKAERAAQRAETHHYGWRMTRVSDGEVLTYDDPSDRFQTATSLPAATRHAREYAGYDLFSNIEVVDWNTGEVVARIS